MNIVKAAYLGSLSFFNKLLSCQFPFCVSRVSDCENELNKPG